MAIPLFEIAAGTFRPNMMAFDSDHALIDFNVVSGLDRLIKPVHTVVKRNHIMHQEQIQKIASEIAAALNIAVISKKLAV